MITVSLLLALQLIRAPAVCRMVEPFYSPDRQTTVFQEMLKADNGNSVAAQRDAEQWLYMDTETRFFQALWQIRLKDPATFDAVFQNYGIHFKDDLRPAMVPPVVTGQ